MPLPLLETLCDDFSAPALDTATWTSTPPGGSLAQAGGRLTVTGELDTVNVSPGWDLRDSNIAWQVVWHHPAAVSVPTFSTDDDAWQFYLRAANPLVVLPGELCDLRIDFCWSSNPPTVDVDIDSGASGLGGHFFYSPGLAVTPSNKPDMIWWRVRDDGADIVVEYSPDAVTWTTLYAVAGLRGPTATGVYPFWDSGSGTTLVLERVGLCGFVPPVGLTRRFARAYIID